METLDGKFLGVYDPTKLEVYINEVKVEGFGEYKAISILNSNYYIITIVPTSNVFTLLLNNHKNKEPLELTIIYKDLDIDIKDTVVCSSYTGAFKRATTAWNFNLKTLI